MGKIVVDVATQTLSYMYNGSIAKTYLISTAKNGVGEDFGSECTPRGRHIIRAKIGQGMPVNTVFVGRRPTGELFNEALFNLHPNRDWILTRILWLSGLEKAKNRLGKYDTMRRYIYFHGSPDHVTMGIPGSKGCIRMRNSDIVELFDHVPVGTEVLIEG